MTNVGASSGDPRREFWVRENKDDTLVGPFTLFEADTHARYLSQLDDKSGLAEVATYVGDRPGDPARAHLALFVVYMFIRGKKTLGGRTAAYHSKEGLPPTG
tara:strand:- start:6116 stop:6421 length:306 start_codon:yes stop_codon:yes gene_type:complete